MKRYFTLLVILLFLLQFALSNNRKALIIGIGDYPSQCGWKQINGDDDIPLVESVLTANGFSNSEITKLVNENATKQSVCDAMQNLIETAELNDFIYIHFSGHGQQITDLNGDEEDGLDESWIPYDAHAIFQAGIYEGENHILDDNIYEWCKKIKTQIGELGKLVVVSDACHSGDGYRSESVGEVIRGRMLNKFLQIAETLIFTYSFSPPNICQTSISRQKDCIDWIYISACKSNEDNHEYQGAGSLSSALYSLKDRLKSLPCDSVQIEIQSWMKSRVGRQTPIVVWPKNNDNITLF